MLYVFGCDGVVNIADDLIIYGEGVEELLYLFGWGSQFNINEGICEFKLPGLTFFGYEEESPANNWHAT